MRDRIRQTLGIVAAACACLAAPAYAVDVVPFAGFRFGGDVSTQQTPTTPSTSYGINAAASYGGIVDVPLYDQRSLEFYYSRQPTRLSSGLLPGQPAPNVTVSVMHVGLADAIPGDDPRLSWLLIGSAGATELSADGTSSTRFSIGLGGAVIWMFTPHVGLRGDIRAFLTFTGGGDTTAICNGGCNVQFSSSAFGQGEASVGIVARF